MALGVFFCFLQLAFRIWLFAFCFAVHPTKASMRDVLLVIADMKLRGTTAEDGRMLWSAIDFIEHAAHKSHDAAKQHMRRLTANVLGSKNYAYFKNNIVTMSLRRANGAAYSTPGLDLDGLHFLLNALDREVGTAFHEACRKVFERIKAGDTTAVEDGPCEVTKSNPVNMLKIQNLLVDGEGKESETRQQTMVNHNAEGTLELQKLAIEQKKFEMIRETQRMKAEISAAEQKKGNKKGWGLLALKHAEDTQSDFRLQLRLREDAQMQARVAILGQLNALEKERAETGATLLQQEHSRYAQNERMMEQEKRWRAMQALTGEKSATHRLS